MTVYAQNQPRLVHRFLDAYEHVPDAEWVLDASEALTMLEPGQLLDEVDANREFFDPEGIVGAPTDGVFGFGLLIDHERRRVLPTVFVHIDLLVLPGEQEDHTFVTHLDESTIGSHWRAARLPTLPQAPEQTVVFGMRPPDELAANRHSGRFKVDGSPRGTIGAEVSWGDGVAYLTAGHSARDKDATGSTEDGSIGIQVAFTQHRRQSFAPDAVADVAVITADAPLDTVKPEGLIAGIPDQTLRAFTSPTTNRSSDVQAVIHTFSLSDSFAHWKDIYQTDSSMSDEGDSGAAVLDENDQLVGHIVGGDSVRSLVQDAQTVLGAAGARLPS